MLIKVETDPCLMLVTLTILRTKLYLKKINVGIDIKPIRGTFRGVTDVYHYYNPATGTNVVVDLDGNFLASWKLGPEQIENLFRNRNIQFKYAKDVFAIIMSFVKYYILKITDRFSDFIMEVILNGIQLVANIALAIITAHLSEISSLLAFVRIMSPESLVDDINSLNQLQKKFHDIERWF